MEMKVLDYQSCLAEFTPRMGNYDWMCRLLRARSMRHHHLFPSKVYRLLKRFGNPRKPFFVGKTEDGIAFLADYRDRYSVMCAVMPDFDSPTLCFLQSCMRNVSGAFLDIGSNMGVVAATMAKYLEGKEDVLAFEPIQETARRAAATFALNNLTNVRLFPIAVGDMDGEIPFYDAPGVSEGASANPTDHGDLITWRKTTAICRRLDSLMQEGAIPKAGFLKIDTEGNELKTIQGAQSLLKRDGPALFFEYFPHVAHSSGWSMPQMETAITQSHPYHFQVVRTHTGQREPIVDTCPPDPNSDEIVDIYCEP